MNKKSVLLILTIVTSLSLVFLVGRWTAPKPDISTIVQMDSLRRDIRSIHKRYLLAVDSIKMYRAKSIANVNEALKSQKQKVTYEKEYIKERYFNHSISVLQRDSIIRAVFYH